VDEGDADIASFFYYLGLAGKKAAPRIKRPLPLLTPEYGLGIPTFTRRYFEDLCSRLKPPCFLVFDNYQIVPQASPFHEIMSVGLSSLPKGIHAAVLSRTDPPPVLTSLIANNKVSMIGWDELRLAPEESKGIARMDSGQRLSAEVIQQMHEFAQGWAAGLILLSQGAKAAGAAPESSAFDPAKIFDYFASELFDRLTGVHFRQTAYLPKITAAVAEKTPHRHAAGYSDLNRGNYFTEREAKRRRSIPSALPGVFARSRGKDDLKNGIIEHTEDRGRTSRKDRGSRGCSGTPYHGRKFYGSGRGHYQACSRPHSPGKGANAQ
jgi:hypothetical protein